ncbi:MAG TPA: hypothetical protein VGG74_14460 [Kofleriaceae bacterium]
MTRRSSWLVIAVLATTSCSIGAPPGFSGGTRWTFPLVDPLNDGLLVTPVFVKGQGPFLFAIDPDANVSIIDERVVLAAHLLIDRGFSTRLWGEDGLRRIRFNAEFRDIRVGDLNVEVRRAIVVPHGNLSAGGREIMGVLGRNVIEDSLVFGFDRDRGLAWLQVATTFNPPAGATRLDYTPTSTFTPMVDPIKQLANVGPSAPTMQDRNQYGLDDPGEPGESKWSAFDGSHGVTDNKAEFAFAHVKIDGRDHVVAVQLGSAVTRLRAAPTNAPMTTTVELDATGARRTLEVSGRAQVAVGPATNDHVAVASFVDHSEIPSNALFFDGTLGLDFFAPFDVAADWSHHAFYLTPRDPSPQNALRLGRWPVLATCAHPGCVTARVTTPTRQAAPPSDPAAAPPSDPSATTNAFAPPAAAAAAAPMSVLHVIRDPGTTVALEVRLRATGRTDLPDLLVELPEGVRDVLAPLRGEIGSAHYDVIDASPFAAPCPGGGGCVRFAE